jgi:hypothetical protein
MSALFGIGLDTQMQQGVDAVCNMGETVRSWGVRA